MGFEYTIFCFERYFTHVQILSLLHTLRKRVFLKTEDSKNRYFLCVYVGNLIQKKAIPYLVFQLISNLGNSKMVYIQIINKIKIRNHSYAVIVS